MCVKAQCYPYDWPAFVGFSVGLLTCAARRQGIAEVTAEIDDTDTSLELVVRTHQRSGTVAGGGRRSRERDFSRSNALSR